MYPEIATKCKKFLVPVPSKDPGYLHESVSKSSSGLNFCLKGTVPRTSVRDYDLGCQYWSKLRIANSFLKFENRSCKSDDFSKRGALDVKTVSMLGHILLQTAGPYNGPPHHAKKSTLFRRTVPLTVKRKNKAYNSLFNVYPYLFRSFLLLLMNN
jgi:hypothetical protein